MMEDIEARITGLLRSGDPAGLELAAVRQWEYDPYMKDGQALPVTFTVNVTFSLKKQDKENRP